MKESKLSFVDGFLGIQAKQAKREGKQQRAFDWDKAAEIIREKFLLHPDLIAEAGLQGDWGYTGGEIFENGRPTNSSYTFLCSNWATPTLILSYDGMEQESIDCYVDENERMGSDTKWDEKSLKILGISL